MPSLRVAYVDVVVLRGLGDRLEVLCLRRGASGRSPGSWEGVHGHIDPGETAVAAARRELHEEAGLRPERLYNLSRVESFYRHSTNEMVLVPAFAAFVSPEAEVSICPEHDAAEWLPPGAALERMTWPRVRREIEMPSAGGEGRGGDAGGYAEIGLKR